MVRNRTSWAPGLKDTGKGRGLQQRESSTGGEER